MGTKVEQSKIFSDRLNLIKSSKIVLNCSSNFTSLRIEEPKKAESENETAHLPGYVSYALPDLKKHFSIKEKIGQGSFSQVFRARFLKDPGTDFAIKCVTPILKWSRVADEVRFLRDLGGDSNIPGVKACFFGNGQTVIVMPYLQYVRFTDLIKDVSGSEIREYMRNLLIALAKVHKNGIIHRDVKPGNFLYDRKKKAFGLIDFGLAHEESVLKKQIASSQVTPKLTSNERAILTDLTKTNSNFALLNKETNINHFLIKKRSADVLTDNSRDNKSKKLKLNENANCDGKVGSHRSYIPETPPKKTEIKTPKLVKASPFSAHCECYKKAQVCNNCLRREDANAHRAGTSGYRAPEVLIKHPHQTTAIDIWSAGVIMVSLLSRRYPFFSPAEDMTSLAEIMSVLGSKRVIKAAKEMNRVIIFQAKEIPPMDLKTMCSSLCKDNPVEIDNSAYDLLNRLLEPNPRKRITATEALNHPFFLRG